MPDEKPKPIHDGYKYPMVETKPPERESLWNKAKKAVAKAIPSGAKSSASSMADRKDQTDKVMKDN